LGITALFIACKYQEIYPPVLSDLVHMTQDTYENEMVLQMETEILQTLEFNFTFATSLSFLETYMSAIRCVDLPTELYTRFLLDFSLTKLPLQRFQPSTVALASLLVTWKKFSETDPYFRFSLGPETQLLDQIIYTETLDTKQVLVCAQELELEVNLAIQNNTLNSVRIKYGGRQSAVIHPLIGLFFDP
jgi:cyclin B